MTTVYARSSTRA